MGRLTEKYRKLDEQVMREIAAYTPIGVEWPTASHRFGAATRR